MTLPRSAAGVLAGHVLFEIEAIDRMYLNLCVRHEALFVRMEVEDLDLPAVAAVG